MQRSYEKEVKCKNMDKICEKDLGIIVDYNKIDWILGCTK